MRPPTFIDHYKLPSSQYHGQVNNNYRRYKPITITPKFLPQGWRYLKSNEEIKRTDFFWSKQNKVYLPVTRKFAWQGLAGSTIPFIRRITDEEN
jgi:hypothetical protein